MCTPGFSTRDEADRASGRGVGMAVVRNTIQQLGGTLTLETAVGRGARFTIELPLTLAIMDALVVKVGEQRFAVPLAAVHEIIEVVTVVSTKFKDNEIMSYRDRVLPLVRLAHLFALPDRTSDRPYALVVGSGLSMAGLVVDRILGQYEIVVRPITDALVQVPGIAGATELGDGQAVLILDASALVRDVERQQLRQSSSYGPPAGLPLPFESSSPAWI